MKEFRESILYMPIGDDGEPMKEDNDKEGNNSGGDSGNNGSTGGNGSTLPDPMIGIGGLSIGGEETETE